MKMKQKFGFAFLLLFFSFEVYAQQEVIFDNQQVRGMVRCGDMILAGRTDDRIYASYNEGKSFTPFPTPMAAWEFAQRGYLFAETPKGKLIQRRKGGLLYSEDRLGKSVRITQAIPTYMIEPQNEGDISYFHFPTEETGFLYYKYSLSVYRSDDGGKIWTGITNLKDYLPKGSHFSFVKSLRFVSAKKGFAVIEVHRKVNDFFIDENPFQSNVMLATVDGGYTWSLSDIPLWMAKQIIRGSIYFHSPDNGKTSYFWCYGDNRIGKTINQGKTWSYNVVENFSKRWVDRKSTGKQRIEIDSETLYPFKILFFDLYVKGPKKVIKFGANNIKITPINPFT